MRYPYVNHGATMSMSFRTDGKNFLLEKITRTKCYTQYVIVSICHQPKQFRFCQGGDKHEEVSQPVLSGSYYGKSSEPMVK